MSALQDLVASAPAKPATDYGLQPENGQAILKDYQHAKKIFVDGNYRLSPKYGFLFYVEFDFNPLISNVSNTAAQELGMIVKSVGLPKYTIDTKVHNAYNRVNIVQNKIKYDPIQIVFHDDQADNVRNFWYDYYSYFYRDSDYADVTYQGISKYQSRASFDWGYSPRPSPSYNNSAGYQAYQYIQAIRIYSLYQRNFSEYQLVNPVITSFSHGSHAQGGSELVEHSMGIQFETVKYLTGYTTEDTAGGFVSLHYDNKQSPLAPAGGVNFVDNGMGGVTRADNHMHDLAYENYMTQGSFSQTGLQSGVVQSAGNFGAAFGGATILSTMSGGFNSGGFSIPNLGSLGAGIPSLGMIGQQLKAGAAGAIGGAVAGLANQVVGKLGSLVNSAANEVLGDLGIKGLSGTNLVGGLAAAISNPSAAAATLVGGAAQFANQQISGALQKGLGPAIAGVGKGIGEAASSAYESVSSAAGDAYNSVAGEVHATYYEATTDTSGYSDLF
jgi:hypothetical protein